MTSSPWLVAFYTLFGRQVGWYGIFGPNEKIKGSLDRPRAGAAISFAARHRQWTPCPAPALVMAEWSEYPRPARSTVATPPPSEPSNRHLVGKLQSNGSITPFGSMLQGEIDRWTTR
jgi:hypothetical protein